MIEHISKQNHSESGVTTLWEGWGFMDDDGEYKMVNSKDKIPKTVLDRESQFKRRLQKLRNGVWVDPDF